jgi:riboflavin kinase/FMN adenylyltransferase
LGFPTANIAIDNPLTLIPADGVYEVVVTVGGREYQAVMNIGVKPTVATRGERTMEAHLIDYSGDLYGQLVKVEFVRRLRGEQVFDNINALRFQIEVDVARVKRGI